MMRSFAAPRKFKQNSPGFTLVETLVALGVLGVFFTVFALIVSDVLSTIATSRVRTVAHTIGQAKMEQVRNLPYQSVGTVGGIPQGPIPATESVVVNGQDFTVTTSIIYVDDPFDGELPSDLINTDYKRVRIEITWSGIYPSRAPVTFVTNIAPKGVETIVGGGTLFVQVFDSQGIPVPNATIAIDNSIVSPQIHMNTLTNANGLVVIPGAPACLTCYQISATKSGFSTDRTYSASEVANPLQPLVSVLEGQISQISFAIDRASTLIVNSHGSRETGFPPIANVFFTLRGSKIIGYDINDEPVLKYNVAKNSGGGTVSVSSLEWDTYFLDFTNSSHIMTGSNPINPIAVLAGTNPTIAFSAVPKGNTSLLLTVKNADNEIQATASATLFNPTNGYISTKSTGLSGSPDFGQTFFGGISPALYNLTINHTGYQEATSSITISGNQSENVTLAPL